MDECEHKWSHEVCKDNEYKLIDIYWCKKCGALKRKETFQGRKKVITIKLTKA